MSARTGDKVVVGGAVAVLVAGAMALAVSRLPPSPCPPGTAVDVHGRCLLSESTMAAQLD